MTLRFCLTVPMMSDIPINVRQQYWLNHIRAAEAFYGSIADYARSECLKQNGLYSWKGILTRRGLMGDEAASENYGGFVRVIAPARPLGTDSMSASAWLGHLLLMQRIRSAINDMAMTLLPALSRMMQERDKPVDELGQRSAVGAQSA